MKVTLDSILHLDKAHNSRSRSWTASLRKWLLRGQPDLKKQATSFDRRQALHLGRRQVLHLNRRQALEVKSDGGESRPAKLSDEEQNTHNKKIVDKVEDLSWAVESGLNLTDTVDYNRSTKQLPAVTHEHVRPEVREVREERIERHIHNYDIYPQIQPIYDLEILPARHFIEDADGNRIEVAESDLPCCTGENQRWRIGLEQLKKRTTPFAAPPVLDPQRKSEMIARKQRETGAEVLPITTVEYREGSFGRSYSPDTAECMPPVQGETTRRGYRPPYDEGLQSVPRILREGRESLMSDNQMEENVAASGTRAFA
ncbi:hypothetical protein PG993_000636 [Apiospora rasikravindrae]|uniref:Uncharacterized protein n=1 Tax=Apiospora rasikravindrae TaxID=990691 RepID=A0ABR1U942_9PEZI